MSEDDKRTIIDSYDGDPEDLVFFQNPEAVEQTIDENVTDTTEQLKTQEKQPEIQTKQPEVQAFDINDPHYENYEPDLYYEYGQGAEPEPIGMPDEKGKDGMGLGTASMVTGICSIFLGCCGLQYVLSIAALTTGICCLVRKKKSGTAKSFAIAGIVCGALALLGGILQIVATTGMSMLPGILQYFVIG